jgi:hypothetical protein
MVKITFYQNRNQQLVGFDCLGHAEYADENDIVCAAASALIINCINSIETFTEDSFQCDSRQEDGMIVFRLTEEFGADTQLLLKSLILGLQEMESNYEEYIDLIFEEV